MAFDPYAFIAAMAPEDRAALRLQSEIILVWHYAKLVLTGLPENQHYILDWGKILFPDKFNLPFCLEMHGYFCEMRDESATSDEAPRGHAKTTIKCFLIPIFQALNEPEKYRHYLNVQSTEDKALAINTSLKAEFEDNKLLIAVYGNLMDKGKWTDGQFVLSTGVIFTAAGAGQSIRGMNYRQIRPDYIMVDDLYDEDDIQNAESTKKKNRWFWGTLYPARAKGKKCCVKIQGTAINECDLMFLLKKSSRFVCRTFRAVVDWDAKVVLWKELNTFESLQADREDMGSLIFFREYQNDRIDDSTSFIKRSWLLNWEYNPDDLRFSRDTVLKAVILGNDPSIGKNVENDFAAYAVVLKWRPAGGTRNNLYIDYVTQGKYSLDERIKKLQSIAKAYTGLLRITQVRIESISGFQDYTGEVKRTTNLPVREITSVKDKISILVSKSRYFEYGQVKLNKNIPQNMKDLLIHQLCTNHPEHDDLRDALLLCLDESTNMRDWV